MTKNLKKYVDDFIDTLEGKSPKTIASYEDGLDVLMTFFAGGHWQGAGRSAKLQEIEPADIDYVLQYFVIKKYIASDALKAQVAKASKALFRYLAKLGEYDSAKAREIIMVATYYAREYPRIDKLSDALWDEVEGETDALMKLSKAKQQAEIARLRDQVKGSKMTEVGYATVLRVENGLLYVQPMNDGEEFGPVRLGLKSLELVRPGDIINMITLRQLKGDTAWEIVELGYVYPRSFECS